MTPDPNRRRPDVAGILSKLEPLAGDAYRLRCMSILVEESVTQSHFDKSVVMQDGYFVVRLTREERDVLGFCLGDVHRRAQEIECALEAIVEMSYKQSERFDET